jgi:acyl transferase domain-containing protein/acyl carrier protein
MGQELYEQEPIFRETFVELSEYARRWTGESIVNIVYKYPGNRFEPFERTLFTHPALFAVQYAMDRTLRHYGYSPDFVLGYSLGEFVALTVSGVLSWQDALYALLHHAQTLERQPVAGRMMTVLASPDLFAELEVRFPGVELAAVNTPGHFVVSGLEQLINQAQKWLADQMIDVILLPVTQAFHSSALEFADSSLRRLLESFPLGEIRTPIISAERATILYRLADGISWRMTRGVIQFQRALGILEALGSKLYVDLGPSGTLASFVRQNLGHGADSEAIAIMTPFAQDRKNLAVAKEKLPGVSLNRTLSPKNLVMTSDEIFAIVKSVILTILPDLDPAEIQSHRTLTELGANSIDRLDITMNTLEALQLHVPMVEFADVSNLQGLVDVLQRCLAERPRS